MRRIKALGLLLWVFVAPARAALRPQADELPDIPNIIDLSSFPELANLSPEDLKREYHPDAHLSTTELIEKYGYKAETHNVVTADHYILELHRITGTKENPSPVGKPPVFLMHGVLSSSADWVITGPGKALPYLLADAGYDVWMGNARGTTYSRSHKHLTTAKTEYWSFSWHEIGIRDLPAMIDFVLEKTTQQKLFYVGHSQGTTSFFVMTSELPGYNDKIRAMFALAPIAYMSHMTSPFVRMLAPFVNQLSWITKLIGFNEFQPTNDFLASIASKVCEESAVTSAVCTNALFVVCGFSPHQTNRTLLPAILGHVPAGASVRQFVHYAQEVNSAKFRQYDHGMMGNWKKYHSVTPPKYDLGKITAPVSLHYSSNDWMSHPKDVQQLYQELGNPIGKFRVPHDRFNHVDYLFAIDGRSLVYEKVIGLMQRF